MQSDVARFWIFVAVSRAVVVGLLRFVTRHDSDQTLPLAVRSYNSDIRLN